MSVAAISVDDARGAAGMAQLVGAEFPVLADPTRRTAMAYGVFDLLGDGVAAPSVFAIDPDRTVRWAYVGRGAGDRLVSADILARMRR